MTTSERSFNQVKSILHKLDRSIDEARERRTQQRSGTPSTPVRETPTPAPAPPGGSPYGRATPIPASRSGGTPQRWGS